MRIDNKTRSSKSNVTKPEKAKSLKNKEIGQNRNKLSLD